MSQVCPAPAATYLGTLHADTAVGFFQQFFFTHGHPETWPPGAAFKLGFGAKKLLPATNAGIGALLVIVPVLARVRAFRAFLSRYPVCLGPQLLLPFSVRLCYGELVLRKPIHGEKEHREQGNE